MARYPLEWGWHTDQPAAPGLPEFTPVMPTLLGGGDPDLIFASSKPPKPDPADDAEPSDSGWSDDAHGNAAPARRGIAPNTEPPPGSPEYQVADDEARKLETGARSWADLSLGEQALTSLKRFGYEGDAHGGALAADSAARRLQQVEEIRQKQEAGEELTYAEKRFLLANRNVASELAASVRRIVDAHSKLAALPQSEKLQQFLGAKSIPEASDLFWKNPGEIASAFGIESIPDFITGLAATATLGPLGGGAILTGSAGASGYAAGLVGALAKEGVDVGNAGAIDKALRDPALMERVRSSATTKAAVSAGTALAMAVAGGRAGKTNRSGSATSAGGEAVAPRRTAAEQLAINVEAGRQHEANVAAMLEKDYEILPQLTVETDSGVRTRLDFVARHRQTGELRYIDAKSGPTSRLTPAQRMAYPEISMSGATVKGAGKGFLPGGTRLPPRPVEIITKQ